MKRKRVVIDQGHGGWDPGATALDGRPEKELTLPLGLAVRTELLARWEVEVLMTRETDQALSSSLDSELRRRAEVANRSSADLLLSLHFDAGVSAARGASLYVWTDQRTESGQLRWLDAARHNKAPLSYGYAQASQPVLAEGLGKLGIPWKGWPVWCADFGVLRYCDGPAMLLEAGYQTNAQDLAAIRQPDFIPNLARVIAQAVAVALALPEREPDWSLPKCKIILPAGEVWGEVRGADAWYPIPGADVWAPVRASALSMGRAVRWIESPPTAVVE